MPSSQALQALPTGTIENTKKESRELGNGIYINYRGGGKEKRVATLL